MIPPKTIFQRQRVNRIRGFRIMAARAFKNAHAMVGITNMDKTDECFGLREGVGKAQNYAEGDG